MMKRQSRRDLGILAVLLVLAAVGVALSVGVVSSAGIGWDSHFDLTTGLTFLSLPGDATLASVIATIPDQDIANGTFRFQLAQWLGSVTMDNGTLDPGDPTAYALVAIVTIVIANIALIILAVALHSVTGSWLPGVLAYALTATMPLWVGISGIAWRDVPVAAGLTIATSGLIVGVGRGKRDPLTAGVLVTLGTFIAVSTRAGSIALVTAVVLLGCAVLVWTLRVSQVATPRTVLFVFGGLVIGVVLATISHPVARLDPLAWLSTSVLLASDNPNATLVKVMAQDVLSNDLPVWYIPAYVLAQMPLLTLVLVGVAAIALASGRLTPLRSHRMTALRAAGILLFVQAAVLPLVLSLGGTNLYDGLRHVLFIFPALFGLVGLIVWKMYRVIDSRSLVYVLTAAVVIAPTLSLYASWRWFPYSYAFINPVAGIVKEPRIWELDYWGLSVREGAERLRSLGFSSVGATPSANSAIPWNVVDLDTLVRDAPAEPWGAYAFLRWNEQLPDFCDQRFVIERDGHMLGVGGSCEDALQSKQ